MGTVEVGSFSDGPESSIGSLTHKPQAQRKMSPRVGEQAGETPKTARFRVSISRSCSRAGGRDAGSPGRMCRARCSQKEWGGVPDNATRRQGLAQGSREFREDAGDLVALADW